ncbi:MAG TPA: DUF5916 domain-containing protein [Longimicrobium sp.]|jgi:hypothetical protein
MRLRTIAFLAAALLAAPAALPAQHNHGAAAPAATPGAAPPATSTLPTPALRAAAASGAVHIDGRLDEAAWAAAEPAGGFVQQRPSPGAPATERTEVRVLYTADAILVGARMFDARPDSIVAQLARRDAAPYSDWFHVVIDGYRDRRSGFRFAVNPRGVKRDAALFNDAGEDAGWDAVWDVATAVDSAGWTAELRIPLSQLRYTRGAQGGEAAWGINFVRDLARRDERSTWSPIPVNYPGFVSRAGDLRGLAGLGSPRRVEIQPYASSRLTRAPGDGANPFYSANQVDGSFGADLKLGITPSLTLTATVNPDFGQVEQDPAVVNLTAFETFLPEQRPFFVEGTDAFRFGNLRSYATYGSTTFFYSRRIGRTPQRFVAAGPGAFVDVPDQSTILAAGKLSGRVAGWSLGVMDAVTAEERARFRTAADRDSTSAVEPRSNYFVGRLRRDLRGGRTAVGALLTAAHRDLGGAELDGVLRSRAFVYGVDGEHSWANREWVLSGYWAASRIDGHPGVIAAAQTGSARYYQRPDADYLEPRADLTSLGGHVAALSLSNNGPVHGSLTYQEVSPGWEPNDLGFQTRTDLRALSGHLGRYHNQPGGVFRSYYTHLTAQQAWNFGGDAIWRDANLNAGATFRNLWSIGTLLSFRPGRSDDRLTRGGPVVEVPAQWDVQVFGNTDPRRPVVGSWHAILNRDGSGKSQRSLYLGVDFRPTSSVQLSFSPEAHRFHATDQWVTTRTDATADATFGRRYVFADLDQTTVALGTRLNWTFTPTLSLQLYARPFLSSGGFGGYKELAAPRTFDFARYGDDRGTLARLVGAEACAPVYGSRASAESVCWEADPDAAGPAAAFRFGEPSFTQRSLRGSAVLRWEYRPGSTLFFVWQQQRSGSTPDGEFDLNTDLFRDPARNVFLVKATYWIGR